MKNKNINNKFIFLIYFCQQYFEPASITRKWWDHEQLNFQNPHTT